MLCKGMHSAAVAKHAKSGKRCVYGAASKAEGLRLEQTLLVMTGKPLSQFLPGEGNMLNCGTDAGPDITRLVLYLSSILLLNPVFDPCHRLWNDAQDGVKGAKQWRVNLSFLTQKSTFVKLSTNISQKHCFANCNCFPKVWWVSWLLCAIPFTGLFVEKLAI
jgi:hypothetical protein